MVAMNIIYVNAKGPVSVGTCLVNSRPALNSSSSTEGKSTKSKESYSK